jgi:PAS domain S-box-containing protein
MQSLLIAIGSIIPLTVGVMTDEILPLVQGIRASPPTSVIGIAVLNLFIFIAMRRYSLFAISPALAADTIIKTMPDSMLVTDLDGKIVLLNEEAQKYFHVPKDEIFGREIVSLFERKEKYEKLYEQVVNRKLEIARYDAALISPLGERIPSPLNTIYLKNIYFTAGSKFP